MHASITDQSDAIAALCRRYAVRRLDLFGSATRADFDPQRSDVDFVAEFDPPVNGDLVSQYFDFKQQLESLLKRDVDLIELSAIRNQRLRREIETTRVPLHAAS